MLRNLKNQNPEKSGNLIFNQKIREFQHFIQNSGKVKELENFNVGSDFHANFKNKLLNIQSYIDTLNGLFLIFFVTKRQILVNITCNCDILVLLNYTILIVSPECRKSLRCCPHHFLKMVFIHHFLKMVRKFHSRVWDATLFKKPLQINVGTRI